MNNDSRDKTPDERHRTDPTREREIDVLVQLVGQKCTDDLDPNDPRNAPFFEWYARELRERQTPAEREATEQYAASFAKRMVVRWAQRSTGVIDVPRSVPLHHAAESATIGVALDLVPHAVRAPFVDLAIAAGVGRELWDEECTEWAEVPSDVPIGRHLALRVAGDSMAPFIHTGDTVLVRLDERLQRGSVIVAKLPDDGYVVKRVGKLERHHIELLSLNAEYPAIRIPRRERTVLGTVVLRWCPHGEAATESG